MRVFTLQGQSVTESAEAPVALPAQGFVWLAMERSEFESRVPEIQRALASLCGVQLVDLHVSDLLNAQLPSHYDYTDQYDLLVFRRLAAARADAPVRAPVDVARKNVKGGPPVLHRIDTSAVGFAVFDRVLLSVHPSDCAVRDTYADRLLAANPADNRPALSRSMPASPADLMLRVVSLVVDAYLDLRRELTRQLDHWQAELLHPRTRFKQWDRLLQARLSLHQLDEICEDQRSAIAAWTESLESLPTQDAEAHRAVDLLKVRSRDVLEHIERVVHHVRRLEQSAETSVQIHFSLQGNRANDIMRTLTVLTAVFLPLNLITGIFGMNFDTIPLLHRQSGFWWALGAMAVIALVLVLLFWRKRYLERSER
jgi:Mg2+ and Co2+ transporter CorA